MGDNETNVFISSLVPLKWLPTYGALSIGTLMKLVEIADAGSRWLSSQSRFSNVGKLMLSCMLFNNIKGTEKSGYPLEQSLHW
jgi:hypothetical protein